MFALLGLLGLAFAGTAFVAMPSSDEDTNADDDAEPNSPSEEPENTNILDLIDVDITEENDTPTADDLSDPVVPLILEGGENDDELIGVSGDDYMDGGDGNDTLIGDDGMDQMHGGDGDDHLDGNDGDDLLYGYIGDDELIGGNGDDKIHGGDGADILMGDDGNDTLLGGYGDDTLIGGAGHDNIQGSEGNDLIDGVTGEETAEKDYLNGSEGDDTLLGNNGDVMSGGDGADRFEVHSGLVEIMDYADDDVLVVYHQGDAPIMTADTSGNTIIISANGVPVASLYGITSFDLNDVQLIAS